MLPSELLVVQQQPSATVITAFHPRWGVAAAPHVDALVSPLQDEDTHPSSTVSTKLSLVAVPWSFEGKQVCWKTVKGKEDSEAFAEKWATPQLNWADWDQWIAQGGRGSPGEAVKFFLEYPFTDASAVTAGLEYHWTGASAVAVETVGSGCLLAALLQRKDCSGRAWLGMGLTGTFPVSFTLRSAIFILIQIPWLAFLLLINVWSVCGTRSKGVLLCQKNKDLLSAGAGHHWFAVAAWF